MSAVPIANLFGSDLTEADYRTLADRWITPELARAAMLRRVDNFTGREIVGQKTGDHSGILIPYLTPGADRVREWCIRRDNPEMERRSDGTLKPKKKYISPPGRSNMLYLPPGITAAMLADRTIPVVITEGQYKTLALQRLAHHDRTDVDGPRFVPVGLSGVWNWRGSVGKTNGPDGARIDIKGPIPDLDWITWTGRRVIIAFDADVSSKGGVRAARAELRAYLRSRGADVGFLEWDGAAGKGIDDHLAAVGPDAVLLELSAVSFSEWKDTLIVNQDGNPRAILANAITALREAPEWSGVLGFNEFSLETVALKLTPWESGRSVAKVWSDVDDTRAAEWLQRQGIYVSIEIAGRAVQEVAESRRFHPVREYLESLKWDGTLRIDGWLSLYFGCEPSDYATAVGARWLISAAARILRPGCKADCVLILEGPQGSYKSTALRTLAQPFFTDEIADLGSKDASMQTRGVWLIEIAELDSMSRGEVSKIKAFMSRTTDRFRPPYGKRLIESPRQCVFAGSVNHSTYLRDETGGRRFWPVQVSRVLIDDLARDRDQLWAEAVHRYRAGEKWWLDSAELNRAAEQEQADRYEGDPWDSIIANWVQGREDVSVPEVLRGCIDKPNGQWTQADQNRVSRVLTSLKWQKFQKRTGDLRERRWRLR